MTSMKRIVLWFLARFRLSEKAVCEMSKDKPIYKDFHHWDDDIHSSGPIYFSPLQCKRCGRQFMKVL